MTALKLVQMQRFEGDSTPSLMASFGFMPVTNNGDGSFTLPINTSFAGLLVPKMTIVSFIPTSAGQQLPDYELVTSGLYVSGVKFIPNVANGDPLWLKVETFDYSQGRA